MIWLAYVLLGALVGFFAGLFGIGGGLILVPVLSFLFAAQHLADGHQLHLALGTSMAAILFSASYSAYAHHQHGAVDWSVVRKMSAGLLLGALFGTLLAGMVKAMYLAIFFALFVYASALQMLLNFRPQAAKPLPKTLGLCLAGGGIGSISSLVSIGGGVLSVPFLLYHHIALRHAIATSAALGLPIAIGGTLGYILNGWQVMQSVSHAAGFVYWPAVLCLAMGSLFTTRLGAQAAHRLPLNILRRGFSIVLCILASKMLWQVFHSS